MEREPMARPVFSRRWWIVPLGIVALSAAAPRPEQPVPAAPPEETLRQSLACELQRLNPRLGRETAERAAAGIERCEERHALPPDLVLAILWVESSARPYAHSPKGALGLMQVMPHMYARLGLPGHAAHVETNLEAGCMLLADNVRRLGEDAGVSAYFWGSADADGSYLHKVKAARAELRLDRPPLCP